MSDGPTRDLYGQSAHDHLVIGLVGDHRPLFESSAVFHAVVEQLAGTLPLWIEALAEKARQEDAAMQVAVEASAMRGLDQQLRRPPFTPLSSLLFPKDQP